MFPIPWNKAFRKKDGSLTTLDEAISEGGGGEPYNLPTASANTKGGVKIGSGLTMNGEVLSANAQLPSSTSADADKVLTVGRDGTPEWATSGGGGGGGNLAYVDVSLSSSPVTINGNSWLTSQFQAPADLVGKNIVSVVLKDANSAYVFCAGASKNYSISASTWIMCAFYNCSTNTATVNSVRIFYQ